MASVPKVGASLHWFFVSSALVGNLSFLLVDNDIELCGFIFAYAALDLVRVISNDCSQVNKYILSGVLVTDDSLFVLHVKLLNGPVHLWI